MRQGKPTRGIGKNVLVTVVLCIAVGGQASAQSMLTVNLDAVETGAHPALHALVTVTDENSVPMHGLDQEAFELNEDGLGAFAPDKVQVVTNQKAAVSVMILVDLSGSVRGAPIQKAKEAIGGFLEALLNEPNDPDRAAFIGFGQTVTVTSETIRDDKRQVGFTNDVGKLLNVINFVDVERSTGGTPLYDAIFRAVRLTAQQPGRRAILVMTDGKDQGSTLTDSDPISEANRQRIAIFPIGLSTGRLDTQYLSRVAVRTGGQFQSAPAPEQLTQLLQNVLARLKEQYVLTYSSRIPKVDGLPHTLSVQITTPRGTSSSKLTFMLGQPATPTPTTTIATAEPVAPTSTLVPAASPTVAPAASPTVAPAASPTVAPALVSGGGGRVQWVNRDLALMIAIAAAGLLLLLMSISAIVLARRVRRRSGDESAQEPPTLPQPPFGEAPFHDTSPRTESTPTVAGQSASPGPEIRTAPPDTAPELETREARPRPFRPFMPPPPTVPLNPPSTFGSTAIIQRGSKPKVLGRLVDKKESGRHWDIDKPTVTIGRAPGNYCVVEHATVSRRHAVIKSEGEDLRLYDLESANGVFVNDKRVHEPVALQDGDTVRLGEVEFIFKRVVL